MSVIKHVLEEEYNRLLELANNYKHKLDSLPKGSISKKTRNNKVYIYRVFRDSDKIRFIYIGKDDSEEARKALAEREEVIKYRSLLKQLKSDIREIRRALNGYK